MAIAVETLEHVVIRFAGDSGDGMQLTGNQFTRTSSLVGNDVSTFPDFPAEIRAPIGTPAGVSAFQVHFSSNDVYTPGDRPNVLVCMNPAALSRNVGDLLEGGILIVNTDKFREKDLALAELETNPLEDGSLNGFRVIKVPISSLTREAVKEWGLGAKVADRCKNFFALGITYWLFSRPLGPTEEWIRKKFQNKSPLDDANVRALHAGNGYAENVELFPARYEVPAATVAPGTYRRVMGNEALALGLTAAALSAGAPIFYGSYPITPASDILHALAAHKGHGVLTFQAEDEIAAVCAAIGASYAGHIGVTGTSGPGLALKAEAVGLAMICEIPLILVNVQRGGPSTGLPTKTEQADLLQALYGRNGESPCVIIAPRTPSDCFFMAYEAVRIATKYMVPVIVLTDGYLANGAEPWRLPAIEDLPDIKIEFHTETEGYMPYARHPETLARPWVRPGTPGLEHRIGGLEKEHITGNVSYDPDNHDFMCRLRAEKVARIANDIPALEVDGADSGILVLTWGSTYGAAHVAVKGALADGVEVGHAHLRYMNPMPTNTGEVLARYDKVIVPEMNLGQLVKIVRERFLVDAVSINKIEGLPFRVAEMRRAIDRAVEGHSPVIPFPEHRL
jgi:2-oxoglutarate ferredoxin oxidoreductase subunit alpha